VATYAESLQTERKAAHVSNPTSPQLNSDFSSWDVGSGSAKVDSRRKEQVVLYIHGGVFSHLADHGLFANVVFVRRFLPIKRSCTTDLSQVYRFARFRQVGSVEH
jgi:acyl-coenzyme A thioesterase PaaI-like protein